ncbi:hypothetical protein FB45DRAFT_900377 [Roridomyces roridus]|uniref:F-box domain-containing protein n=1 Tax=Roridomyces roridus TaxID=1738132 RepID=A0AAD7FWA3_9AGAR|nr:hypothetical protein FB45DRAFT_900377 [Roridomyces roridus]
MPLLSLPNELLVAIFENPQFPPHFLCILALSCRRLHFLALPIYFARKGMPLPSKSAIITLQEDERDMLAALNMALFLTSMEDMTLIFPHPSCVSIYPLLPHLRRVRRFISRFSALGRITLQLDTQTSVCNLVGDDGALRAWSCALCDLLNAVVERCTDLTVEYGYFTRSYILVARTPKGIRRIVKALRKLIKPRDPFSGASWEFRRSPEQGRASVHRTIRASSARNLTALHIQSGALVLPPCLAWTLSLFSSNSITTLSICNISLERRLWNPVLTLIAKAAPSLTNVTLSGLEYITDVEILGFCARIPRLTTLEIGLNEETRGFPTNCAKGPFPQFNHLEHLKAPANFILYLLRPQPCFPKLQSLSVWFHGPRDIRTIAARLVAIGDAMQARRISPLLSVSVLLLFNDLHLDLDAMVKLPHEYKKALGLVGGLDLVVWPSTVAQVASWINMFPSAKQITISTRFEVDMEMLFRELAKNISAPRTASINGTIRTLECIT